MKIYELIDALTPYKVGYHAHTYGEGLIIHDNQKDNIAVIIIKFPKIEKHDRQKYEDDTPCRKCPQVLTCESTDCPKRFKVKK
jgi:hypothetical protein